MKLLMALALFLAFPAVAGDWSCTQCTYYYHTDGTHWAGRYDLYYKGNFHSHVEKKSAGRCRFDQNTNGKCAENSSWHFDCGELMCAGNSCYYDTLYGGYQYDRKRFQSKGSAMEAMEGDPLCK